MHRHNGQLHLYNQAQWPTPPIQSGYNGVYCTDAGIDVVAQNFLALNIGTPSVLSFQSGDTSDNTINIISKGLNFINTIDNSNQLIIDNEGIFLKQFDREDPLNVSEGYINLQDWMAKIQEIVASGRAGARWSACAARRV